MSYQSDIEILQKKSLLKDARVFFRDYVNNRSLNPVAPNAPQVTHARSTTATYTNSAGLITSAAINEPRFDFEPDLRTNKLLYSQEFDNAIWVKTNATVTANATTAPDSTTTADKIVESVAVGVHTIQQNFTAATTVYTFSVSLKASERTWALVRSGEGAADGYYINLSSGVIGSTFGSPVSYAITSQGNGWYRLSVTVNRTAGTSGWAIEPANADNGRSYTGDGTSGIYIWGAQLEIGAITPYQATPNALTPPRCKGLLIEEARSNLVTYSGDLTINHWQLDQVTAVISTIALSPNGTEYMTLVGEQAVTTAHDVAAKGGVASASIPVVSGTTYTGSVYLKRKNESVSWVQVTLGSGGFNLGSYANVNIATGEIGTYANLSGVPTMTNVGSGIWRATISAVATTTGNSNGIIVAFNNNVNNATRLPSYLGVATNEMYIWGGQLEAGAFSTSYIPTTSAAVTRGADRLYMSGANFSSWFNQIEGTFDITYQYNGLGTAPRIFEITGVEKLLFVSGASNLTYTVNGTANNATQLGAGIANRAVCTYTSTNSTISTNGSTPTTVSITNTMGATAVDFGNRSALDRPLNGHLRKIAYRNKALPPRLVKALSQTT